VKQHFLDFIFIVRAIHSCFEPSTNIFDISKLCTHAVIILHSYLYK